MRVLRIALGAAVGLGATFSAAELWKRIVHLEMRQGVQLSHGVNELVSFLPVAIVNGYLLWRIHGRTFGMDGVWSIIGMDALYCGAVGQAGAPAAVEAPVNCPASVPVAPLL